MQQPDSTIGPERLTRGEEPFLAPVLLTAVSLVKPGEGRQFLWGNFASSKCLVVTKTAPSLWCDVPWLYLIWQTPSLCPPVASCQFQFSLQVGRFLGFQPLSGSGVVGLPQEGSLWSLSFCA